MAFAMSMRGTGKLHGVFNVYNGNRKMNEWWRFQNICREQRNELLNLVMFSTYMGRKDAPYDVLNVYVLEE